MGGQPPALRRRRVLLVTLGALAGLGVAYLTWIVASHQISASRKRTCLHNVSQLATAMRLYALDYNEYLFFDHGDAFSPPRAPGQAGQTQYLKEAMAMRNYVKDENNWYCPADPFAKKDFSCDPRWSGSLTYRNSGIGYAAIPQSEARDPGIRALHRRLIRDYGREMRVDHAFSSYRFYPFHDRETEGHPVYVDIVVHAKRAAWGAYGYWDINPSSAPEFEEDLPFHFLGKDHLFGDRIYGKTYGFRDGHSVFYQYDPRGISIGGGEPFDPS